MSPINTGNKTEIEEYLITPVLLKLRCRKDGCDGLIESIGESYSQGMLPTQHRHQCQLCQRFLMLEEVFPRIEHRDQSGHAI